MQLFDSKLNKQCVFLIKILVLHFVNSFCNKSSFICNIQTECIRPISSRNKRVQRVPKSHQEWRPLELYLYQKDIISIVERGISDLTNKRPLISNLYKVISYQINFVMFKWYEVWLKLKKRDNQILNGQSRKWVGIGLLTSLRQLAFLATD